MGLYIMAMKVLNSRINPGDISRFKLDFTPHQSSKETESAERISTTGKNTE
jgi:hypothetical protein